MKKVLILSTLLVSMSSFATDCTSVDEAINKYRIGFIDQMELSEVIDCNLNEVTTLKTLCNTKVGLKKDQLMTAVKMYDVGMITKEELDQVKVDLEASRDNCK
jgi:hypothetical protein